jgi:hypothetical protein
MANANCPPVPAGPSKSERRPADSPSVLSSVQVWIDPDMPLVPLLRDLASVGLTLANDQAGRTWLWRSAAMTAKGVAHG